MCKKKVVQRKKTSLKATESGPVWNEVIIFHLEHGVEVCQLTPPLLLSTSHCTLLHCALCLRFSRWLLFLFACLASRFGRAIC